MITEILFGTQCSGLLLVLVVKNVKNRLSVVSVYTNRLSVVWIELIPEVTRVALFGMD